MRLRDYKAMIPLYCPVCHKLHRPPECKADRITRKKRRLIKLIDNKAGNPPNP